MAKALTPKEIASSIAISLFCTGRILLKSSPYCPHQLSTQCHEALAFWVKIVSILVIARHVYFIPRYLS